LARTGIVDGETVGTTTTVTVRVGKGAEEVRAACTANPLGSTTSVIVLVAALEDELGDRVEERIAELEGTTEADDELV
jgi:hypothetical protein